MCSTLQPGVPKSCAAVAGLFPVRGGELMSAVLLETGGPCSVRLAACDLFRAALLYRADQLVVVHNHVDGAGPSETDQRTTRRLRSLGASLGIPLVGHLVISGKAASWVV